MGDVGMRVALFAADYFAVPLCEALIESGDLACLVTQPDKPSGRGRVTMPMPVREMVEKAKIPVCTPESLKDDDFKTAFEEINPQISIVAAYGEYIPSWIRNRHPFPCVNVHPSLLPRWRGADPIRAAIITGDTKAGVTLHFTEKKMDSGDILSQFETRILPDETYNQLRDFLALASVGLVKNLLARLLEISIKALAGLEEFPSKEKISTILQSTKQNEKNITFAPKLEKESWWIDWKKDGQTVHNLIRGLSPDPGARTGSLEKPLIIFRTSLMDNIGGEPGCVVKANRDGLWVACGTGAVNIISIQPSGKRIMNAVDYINGYRPKIGGPLVGAS